MTEPYALEKWCLLLAYRNHGRPIDWKVFKEQGSRYVDVDLTVREVLIMKLGFLPSDPSWRTRPRGRHVFPFSSWDAATQRRYRTATGRVSTAFRRLAARMMVTWAYGGVSLLPFGKEVAEELLEAEKTRADREKTPSQHPAPAAI